MLAQSFTKPQTQRLAVLNSQYDLAEIARRVESGSNPNFDNAYMVLFPRTSVNEDWCMYEGDILYGPIESGRKRRRTIEGNTQGQQPYVLSSLNGMFMDLAEFNRVRGHTQRAKLRNAFKKHYEVFGLSLKNQAYESYKKAPLDNPVTIIGGVFHMPNLGTQPIKPMDLVVWDVPEPNAPMVGDTTNFMPHTPTMRKLVTEPMDLTKSVHAEDIVTAIETNSLNSDEGDIIQRLAELFVLLHGGNVSDASDIQDTIKLMKRFATDDGTARQFKKSIHDLLEAIAAPMNEQKSRIIGRCLRGAQPGERMDILVLR